MNTSILAIAPATRYNKDEYERKVTGFLFHPRTEIMLIFASLFSTVIFCAIGVQFIIS